MPDLDDTSAQPTEPPVIDLAAKAEEYLAGWKRALADYDNLKKDSAREREDVRRLAQASSAEGLIRLLDMFDQALRHEPPVDGCDEATQKAIKAWLGGVLHIRTAMGEEIRVLGLEPIDPPLGSPPLSLEYESVGERHEEGKDIGTILEVVSRGWKIAGRILRPAKVILAS